MGNYVSLISYKNAMKVVFHCVIYGMGAFEATKGIKFNMSLKLQDSISVMKNYLGF